MGMPTWRCCVELPILECRPGAVVLSCQFGNADLVLLP